MSNKRVVLVTILVFITILVLGFFVYLSLKKNAPSSRPGEKSSKEAEMIDSKKSTINSQESPSLATTEPTPDFTNFKIKYANCQPTSFYHSHPVPDELSKLLKTTQMTYIIRVLGTDNTDASKCLVTMGYNISIPENIKGVRTSGEAECRVNKSALLKSVVNLTMNDFDQNDIIDNRFSMDLANSPLAERGDLTELMEIRDYYASQTLPIRLSSESEEGTCVAK